MGTLATAQQRDYLLACLEGEKAEGKKGEERKGKGYFHRSPSCRDPDPYTFSPLKKKKREEEGGEEEREEWSSSYFGLPRLFPSFRLGRRGEREKKGGGEKGPFTALPSLISREGKRRAEVAARMETHRS